MVTLLKSLNDKTSSDGSHLRNHALPLASGPPKSKRCLSTRQPFSSPVSRSVQAHRANHSTAYEGSVEPTCNRSRDEANGSLLSRLRPRWDLRPDGRGNLVLMRSDEREPDQKDLKDIKIATYHLDGLVNQLTHSTPGAEQQPSSLTSPFVSDGDARDVSVEAEMPDTEPEKEIVPQDIEELRRFLVSRFTQMRQTPKKDITPLIINFIDPSKRSTDPYSDKGEERQERPIYWAPPEYCQVYRGPHHMGKTDLPNLLAWLVLLPILAPRLAEDRLTEARRKKHYEDWSAILEHASEEFEIKSKKDGHNGKAKVAAEAKAFRDVAYMVRDFDISRDASDPLMIDGLPKLAIKNNGGGKEKVVKNGQARPRDQLKRLLKRDSISDSDDGSDTEEDDDTIVSDQDCTQDDMVSELQQDDDDRSCRGPPAKRAKVIHHGNRATSKTVAGNLMPNSLASINDAGCFQTQAEDSDLKHNHLSQHDSALITEPQVENLRTDGLHLGTETSIRLAQSEHGLPLPAESAEISFSSVDSFDTDYTAMSQVGGASSYPYMMHTPPPFEWASVPTGGFYPSMYPYGNANSEVPRSFRFDVGGVPPQISTEQPYTRHPYISDEGVQYY